MKTKNVVCKEETYLKIIDSSSLVLSDLGTLIIHRNDVMPLLAHIGNRLAAAEESFVDVWVGEDSNALAFDLTDVLGVFVTTTIDQDGNIIEIKLVPERAEREGNEYA